jgi:hypothetical protein
MWLDITYSVAGICKACMCVYMRSNTYNVNELHALFACCAVRVCVKIIRSTLSAYILYMNSKYGAHHCQ